MTTCGWLADQPGYIGGAELSQAEFRAAAPEGVEVIDCPPGKVAPGLDRYVAHNVCRYSPSDVENLDSVTWYHHDLSPHINDEVRGWLDAATHIFCSALQCDAYGWDGHLIPPALDLSRFKPSRQVKKHTERKGTCSIGQWRGPGKGANLLAAWAEENGPVDVYGVGDFQPLGPNINHKGPLAPGTVPQTLWSYERFVFLPTALEPFSRSVAEAWAAGCSVITNRQVGASEWLTQPEKLASAADDFWKVVLG